MSCRFAAVFVFLLLSGALAFAQFRTVTVQNAGDNPVPATIQNTPSVNVANTPTVSVSGTVNTAITGTPSVNATITGSPVVTIAGRPAVSIINLPTGTAGPDATTALATKSLDNPALQPFQQSLVCTAQLIFGCQDSLIVPAGKQLVLEYVQLNSLEAVPDNNQTLYYNLITSVGGQSQRYIFAPGVRIGVLTRMSEHQVRIYADPGTTVVLVGNSTTNTTAVNYYALLSGYLVNVP